MKCLLKYIDIDYPEMGGGTYIEEFNSKEQALERLNKLLNSRKGMIKEYKLYEILREIHLKNETFITEVQIDWDHE